MRKAPGKWRQQLAAFWDGLCALRERGAAWVLGCRGQAPRSPAMRARLRMEELEPRLLLSAPVAVADSYSGPHDRALVVSAPGVLANDTQNNNDPLSASPVSGPSHGTLSLNSNGSFTFTPTSGYTGTDSFTYQATDTVTSLVSNTATVSLNITDTAPVAANDSYSVHQGQILNVSVGGGVLANDTDADGDTLSAVLVSGPSHATYLSLNSDGSFNYSPTPGFTGTDSFTYHANDGALNSGTATVTIHVTDTAPVAANDSYTVSGSYLLVNTPGVLANDTDADGDALHTVLVSGPSHAASLSLNSDGSFNYSYAAGFAGVDHFTYQANDGALNSNTATVSIGVNDTAPTATSDAYVLHGGGLTVAAASGVLHNDTDSNGDSLSAVLVGGPAHAATFSLNADGSFSYAAASGYSGSDSFTYQASDGVLQSGTTTVTLAAPTLSATGVAVTATAGTSTGTVTVATVTDTDTALTASGLTATIQWGDGSSSTATAANGGITGSAGAFTIQGIDTYFAYGVDPITVTVQDTVNGLSATASSSATVSRPLTLSSPGNQTSTEGATVSLALSHTYSGTGTLSYDATGLPPGLAINPSTGTISGTVALGASASGSYVVRIQVSDGTYSDGKLFTWTVASPISLTNPGTQTSAEAATISVALSASDSSGGTLNFAAAGLPPGLKINTATGAITGTVGIGAAAGGPFAVTVTAGDGTYSASQTFTWNVASAVTLSNPGTQTSTEGTTVSLALSASDTSGGTLAFTAAGLPNGLAINTATGAITGTVAAGAADRGPFSVTVVAGDSTSSASQTFTWNVASPISITTPADQTNNAGATVSLSLSVSDSTGGTLTYGALGLPAGLSINPSTGAITGTLTAAAAASSPYSVTLLAADGTYRSATTFNWTVNSPVTLTAPADQSSAAGTAVSLSVSATGSGTLAYSATGLPDGLAINSSTGAITGTLSTGGAFAPTVTAGNGTYSTSVSFNWNVSSPISITDPGPQSYNAGDAVSLQVQASDSASGTLTYSATGLPSGLSMSSSTGLIAGTLSASLAAGVYNTTLSVSDGTHTAKLPLAWTIFASGSLVLSNPGSQTSAEGGSVSLTPSTSYGGSGTLKYAAAGLPPGLKINPSTGVISGTFAFGDAALGPFLTTVTVTDGSASDSQNFTWNVSGAVSLTNPGTQTSTEGGSVSLSLSASYYGSGSLSYAALGLPTGLKINPTTGVITGTVAAGAADSGPYTVTVQASAAATTTDQTFTWNVSSPITLTVPADQTNSEGDTVSLSLSAADSSSGTLTYAAQGLLPGLKINPSTGAISGTVALGAGGNGPYAVTVVAQDGTYRTSQTFNWTVNSPVTFTTPADQTSTEGVAVSLSLSASDSTSGTLTYAALGLPPGLVLNPTTGAISGTITAGAAASGPYTVTVAAGDGTSSGQTTFTWNVNSPVSITTPADQTNNAGDTVSLSLSASDSHTGTLVYAASGLPDGLSISSSTGAITGTLTHGGTWQPTVTVGDGTYSNSINFAWTVASPIAITDAGDQSNAAGNVVSVQISATDTATGTLTFSASGLPSGVTINSSTGLISGTISSGAASGTPYTTTITVTDGTHTAVDTFAWTVSAAGPVVLLNPGSQSNARGDELALSLQGYDTAGGTLLYTATGLPAGLYLNAVTGLIFGTVASGASSSSVTVEASDGTNTATQTFTWTVNAAGTVTLSNPGDQTSSEGATVSLALTSSDSSTGTRQFMAFGLPAGLKINPSTGTITGTVALGASASGPYSVTVVANDGTYSAAQTFAWNVNSPVAITTPADQASTEGASVSLALSASDSSSGTLSYAALGLPSGLVINPSTGAITGTVALGNAANGPYSVTVVAADGSYSSSQTFNWTVNSPVTLTTPADQTNNEGDTVSLSVSGTDSATGTLHYSAVGLPGGLSINASTGAITGTVAVGDAGVGLFSVTVLANDGTYSSSQSFQWDVSGAVSITDPGAQANTVGDIVSLQVQATDSGSGTLVYAASGLPNGLSINTSTGLISGTISSGATAIGTFSTTVTVGDGTATVSDTFTWAVMAAGTVTLATPSNQSSTEGNTVSLALSASDSSSGTLKYFAEGLPPGVKINPSTGAITGTVALGDAATGPYTVSVIATDGTSSAEESFLWTVASPVTITTLSTQSGTEGGTVSLSVGGSDLSGGTLAYSAVGLPPGLKINTSTGAISGTLALGSAASGTYSVTVTAGDGTYSTSQTFAWAPASPITLTDPAAQTNYEGDTPSLSLSATDTSSGTVVFSAVGLPPGLKINPSTGVISGTLAAGASVGGPSSVVVTASDGTYSASQTFTWNVASPVAITDPGEQRVAEGETVRLQIQASSVSGGTLSFSVDGRLPSGLSMNATGLISGTIASGSANAGPIASKITVINGTSSATLTINWIVLEATQFVNVALAPANLVDDNSASGPLKDALANASPQLKQLIGLGNDNANFKDVLTKFRNAMQMLGVNLGGALTGDIFDKAAFNFFTNIGNASKLLLTINGIRTDDAGAQQMLNSVQAWKVGANAKYAIQNGTHGLLGIDKLIKSGKINVANLGLGDFTQIGLNELGFRDLVAIRAAVQIELAAAALRKSNAKDKTIIVVAHSQGTMVFLRALSLLSKDTKAMIKFYGNGGETFVPNDGLKSAENFFYSNDLVPFLGARARFFKKVFAAVQGKTYVVHNLGLKGPQHLGWRFPNVKAHSWTGYEATYSSPQALQQAEKKQDLVKYPGTLLQRLQAPVSKLWKLLWVN